MTPIDQAALSKAVAEAARHPSVACMAAGLDVVVRFGVAGGSHTGQASDLCIDARGVRVVPSSPERTASIEITADGVAWASAMDATPPPLYQSFSAWQLRNEAFKVDGDALAIAQARSFLECLVDRWHASSYEKATDAGLPSMSGIEGRYHRVEGPRGQVADVFVETSGQGAPLLCLHTAGSDSRQYHGVMASHQLAKHWQAIAFDMPAHGRSMPARPWDGEAYKLDQADYLAWCVAVIEQVVRKPVTVLGCSMGAAMALVLAASRPDLVSAVVALEAPVRPRGRRNAFLTHAQVNGGWHTSAYVRGLMSPSSPVSHRRGAAWIYSQGAPGVYDGDLMFYSDEFDGELVAKSIDGKRTPVVLMTGDYDFSAVIADAHALSVWIEDSRVVEMPGLGHFPMTEHPAALLGYLLPELDRLRSMTDGSSDTPTRTKDLHDV